MNDRARGQASENGPESPADKDLTAPEHDATGEVQPKSGPARDTQQERFFALEFGWQGPLPPPKQLAEFEKVHPGAAERIIQMAEREQNNRHQKEMATIRSRDQWLARGQWLAFAIVLAALGVVTYLVANGSPIQGVAPVFIALSGLVGSAIWSSVMGRQDRKSKSIRKTSNMSVLPEHPE